MSFQTEVSHALTHLWNQQFRQKEVASLTVPMQNREYVNSNDESNVTQRIFMSHNELPEMISYNFWDHTANAHNLLDEFAYECVAQEESGAFHLLGSPGLFNISFRRFAVTFNEYPNNLIPPEDFGIQLRHVQYTSNGQGQHTEEVVTKFRPNQSVQIFMSCNDRFFLETDWGNMNQSNDNYWVQGSNQLLITRLSRNPYFKSLHEYID